MRSAGTGYKPERGKSPGMAGAPRARNPNFFAQGCGAGQSQQAGLMAAMKRAADTGHLNLSQKGLEEVPRMVYNFGNETVEGCNWWDQCTITKLDLSHNALRTIPSEIGQLADCSIVLLPANQLCEVPTELFDIPLKLLNLAKNALARLPPALGHCATIVELDLRENKLASLTNDLSGMVALEVLHVACNNLSCLPSLPPRLKRLNASQNQLYELSSSVFRSLQDLRELIAAKNRIRVVEQGCLVGLRQLVTLDISENVLVELPELPASPALDSISVAFNRLTALPRRLSECSGLSVLLAHNNTLKSLPEGIETLNRLNTLDVSNNDLGQLPLELGLLASLKRINIQGNPLRSLPQHVVQGSTEQLKRCLRERLPVDKRVMVNEENDAVLFQAARVAAGNRQFVVEGEGLEALPQDITLPEELEVFNAARNALASIAIDFTCFRPALLELRLEGNRLRELPVSASDLPCVRHVNLAENQISSLPSTMKWPRLQIVDLSVNRLSSIPPAFVLSCPALHELRLRANRISSVQPLGENGVSPHGALAVLDLEQNQLADLPKSLPEALPRLTTLLLANNNLSGVPPSFAMWSTLRAVTLHGNPLRQIRTGLVQKGWGAVRDFLQTRIADEPEDVGANVDEGSEIDSGVSPEQQRLEDLRVEVAKLQDEISNATGLSQAQIWAMKKNMQKKNAERMRLERQQESLRNGKI